jgi:class 3 adenylate cyclase
MRRLMAAKTLADCALLLIDDQEANLDLLDMLLSETYSTIHRTTDPRQALALYQETQPDLVLVDLHMPHLDGFAVLAQLRAAIAPDDYVPILVLTADITPAVKERALAEGARDFLTKPLDGGEVLLRVRNLLDTRLLHLQLHERNRLLEAKMAELERERQNAERLLLNVLPAPVADRLRAGAYTNADQYDDATVLFADIEQFTEIAVHSPPATVVELLNTIFSAFDYLVEAHGLEKIKTIGDAYMVVGGVPAPHPDPVGAMADLALAMQWAIAQITDEAGRPYRLRIGIHTGPVIAGVLGTTKLSYDLWGDTVNTASRMESHGQAGTIQVSEVVYARLAGRYRFAPRGPVAIKGKGEMDTYWLLGKADAEAAAITSAGESLHSPA